MQKPCNSALDSLADGGGSPTTGGLLESIKCDPRSVEQEQEVPSLSEETAARHKPRVQVMASLRPSRNCPRSSAIGVGQLCVILSSKRCWEQVRSMAVETSQCMSQHLAFLTAEVSRRVNSHTWNAWYRELQSVLGFSVWLGLKMSTPQAVIVIWKSKLSAPARNDAATQERSKRNAQAAQR